jgi:hypothetical protein
MPKSCEDCFDLATGTGVVDLYLQPDGVGSRLHISHSGFGIRSFGRIDEHGDASSCRHKFVQELQPLCGQFGIEKVDASQVAGGAGEADDQV